MPLIKTPEELKTALRQGEGKDLEFKADVSTDRKTFLKTVVAFANGIGGTIIFGIDDTAVQNRLCYRTLTVH